MNREQKFTVPGGPLECTGCRLFMIPPIYVCNKNHSYCADCITLTANMCTTCKVRTTKRNEKLEKLTKTAVYTCRWSKFCGHFSAKHLRDHEFNCGFRQYKCPALCGFVNDLEDIIQHMKTLHPKDKLILLESTLFEGENKINTTFFLVAYNEIFTCDVIIGCDAVRWCVRFPWPLSRAKWFSFHLEVCKVQYNMELCKREPCFWLELSTEKLPPCEKFRYILIVLDNEGFVEKK